MPTAGNRPGKSRGSHVRGVLRWQPSCPDPSECGLGRKAARVAARAAPSRPAASNALEPVCWKRRRIRITLAGYQPWEKQVMVNEGSRFTATLAPERVEN